MGDIHFHPNGDVKPEPLIHMLLDRKDKIRNVISIVEYDNDHIEIVHTTMKKKDLCYFKDLFMNYVVSRIP